MTDVLVQRYMDELTGEWTTEKAFVLLQNGLLKLGVSAGKIHSDAKLVELIPSDNRRQKIQEWSRESGLELDVLKPNGFLSGMLVFIFFACIPLGIGMDWFVSGIGMVLSAVGIFVLNKTARNFKMETLGQMAEAIAWKLYLGQQKKGDAISVQSVRDEVKRAMQMN